MWVAIPLDIVSALLIMRLAAFGPMKEGIARQFAIFRDKHTWSMTALYIVTFGSFIGFDGLPLPSITVIFGISHVPDAGGVLQHTLKNPNARPLPSPTLGSARSAPRSARSAAGSPTRSAAPSSPDHLGHHGRASVAVGYVMMLAYGSATPGAVLPVPFLGLFLVLFAPAASATDRPSAPSA